MSEYERTATIQTPPQAVYDFVSKVENLPCFMPTTDSAQSLGGEHVRVAGAVKGHSYSADGYFHTEPNAQPPEGPVHAGSGDSPFVIEEKTTASRNHSCALPMLGRANQAPQEANKSA